MDDEAWGLSTLPQWQVPTQPSGVGGMWPAIIAGASQVLGSAVARPPNQSRADSQSNPVFNSSGWSVDFGPGSASASAVQAPNFATLALIAGVVLVGFVAWAKFRK